MIFCGSIHCEENGKETNKKPNILLILSDDQDSDLHGMYPMDFVRHEFARESSRFLYAVNKTLI